MRYRQVRSLHPSGNPLGDEGVAALAGSLVPMKTFNLSEVGLSKHGCEAFWDILTPEVIQDSSLSEIDLSSNELGDDGVKILAPLLVWTGSLALVAVGMTSAGVRVLAGNATEYEKQLKHHGTWRLEGNRIGVPDDVRWYSWLTSGSWTFGALVPRLAGLKELDLARNRLSVKDCIEFMEGLSDNPIRLEKLNLSWNSIGDRGVSALAKLLAQVHYVILHDVGLTDMGCYSLADALASRTCLTRKLHVGDNYIQSPQATAKCMQTACMLEATPSRRGILASPTRRKV